MTAPPPAAGPGADYVLPLRWADDRDLADLTMYLRWLARLVSVIVVDASPERLYAAHAGAWAGLALHLRPDPDLDFANGKVNGVVTGVRRARSEYVVIADDDVRYDEAGLREVVGLLGRADLVRPQNYFDPAPWHARWDTARSLLNRAAGADYPGTFGVRRATFAAMGGYDGDVLFENLELIRTVRAHGGVEARPLGRYVRRRPPDVRRFWGQRVRQAYDDAAQPPRMALFLAVPPALAAAARWPKPGAAAVALGAAATIALAEAGRRRAGGAGVFPASATLFAPIWVLERGACGWLALAARFCRGGIGYAGRRIRRAAHSRRELARRAAGGTRPVTMEAPPLPARGIPPACASRRRTASSPTARSGTARPSAARDRQTGRPGCAT